MDIKTWISVLWRFRFLVAAGLLLATCLALLSFARVELDGWKPAFSYRADEVWVSRSTLLVTQEGFPWGRAVLDEVVEVPGTGEQPQFVPKYSPGDRYVALASIYAELAKGDAVQRQVLPDAEESEGYDAHVATAPNGSVLPRVIITGHASSPDRAEETAGTATAAFLRYLERQQASSQITADTRADVSVVNEPTKAELFEGRRMARPIFIFLLIVMAVIGLAFVLENLRPRRRPPAASTPILAADAPSRARRSA